MTEIDGAKVPIPAACEQHGEGPCGNSRRTAASLADGVLTNIRNGVRMAVFRGIGRFGLDASPGAFAALVFFDILLHLLLAVALVGPDGEFAPYQLAYAVFHVPMMLLTGFFVARIARRNNLLLELPVAYIAIGIPIDLLAAIYQVVMYFGTASDADVYFQSEHFYGFFGWWALAVLAATLRMAAVPRRKLFLPVIVLTVFLFIPLWYNPRGELWQTAEEDSAAQDKPAVADEEAVYAQPALLDGALARIRPGAKAGGNLFFVGFAAYGSQDVFKKEMETVQRLFLGRFDTMGRSMVMVNNPETVLKYPLATATSLERALKRVGEVMNRDNDILFLYLTSHGSENHRLSVELPPLQLRDIDPAMLRRMLDKSGIRWRVIAVSACYSGGFIEQLKSPDTLIMTSTDADRNSFGCSNDSDFTWFGKALFDEELRRTYSFTEAFQRAAVSIQKREATEGEEPSNPQIYVGEAIRPRLRQLEMRLMESERLRRQKLDRADLTMLEGETLEIRGDM